MQAAALAIKIKGCPLRWLCCHGVISLGPLFALTWLHAYIVKIRLLGPFNLTRILWCLTWVLLLTFLSCNNIWQ